MMGCGFGVLAFFDSGICFGWACMLMFWFGDMCGFGTCFDGYGDSIGALIWCLDCVADIYILHRQVRDGLLLSGDLNSTNCFMIFYRAMNKIIYMYAREPLLIVDSLVLSAGSGERSSLRVASTRREPHQTHLPTDPDSVSPLGIRAMLY